jgi:hypothetical protein
MFPADSIVRAATRWLRLLRTSTLAQASGIIRADASYADLTQTQYASALEWLRNLQLFTDAQHGLELSALITKLPDEQINQLLFERILEGAEPAWLPDADLLVLDPAELPQDAAALAGSLGLSERVAFTVVRHVHGRIDLSERTRVGLAGERALIELLEHRWPGSTTHVSQTGDGFGYDVLFRQGNAQWHLEVKATTRRGRLVIYLSRHEHEVSLQDPHWRLVVVGLNNHLRLQALATARYTELLGRAPRDICGDAKWQSTSYELTSKDLQRGLSFLDGRILDQNLTEDDALSNGSFIGTSGFTWMPLALQVMSASTTIDGSVDNFVNSKKQIQHLRDE